MSNKLHVYTGPGKGKTTAAMGLALRSLGHGGRVLIACFMKNGESGELKAFRAFPNVSIHLPPPMEKFTFQMSPAELRETAQAQTAFARSLIAALNALRPQTIILDELCPALANGLIDEEAARALLSAALSAGETAVTGRDAPDWLVKEADYVSRILSVKHPYDTEGLAARPGVEW